MPLLPAHPKKAPMASGVSQLLVRHKAVLAYLFFGVCTTTVNVAVIVMNCVASKLVIFKRR